MEKIGLWRSLNQHGPTRQILHTQLKTGDLALAPRHQKKVASSNFKTRWNKPYPTPSAVFAARFGLRDRLGPLLHLTYVQFRPVLGGHRLWIPHFQKSTPRILTWHMALPRTISPLSPEVEERRKRSRKTFGPKLAELGLWRALRVPRTSAALPIENPGWTPDAGVRGAQHGLPSVAGVSIDSPQSCAPKCWTAFAVNEASRRGIKMPTS